MKFSDYLIVALTNLIPYFILLSHRQYISLNTPVLIDKGGIYG